MAEDMITRAAIAIAAVDGFKTKRVALANYSKHARAALLAALEDEALIFAVARVMPNGIHDARAALLAIKAHAQGEQQVRSDGLSRAIGEGGG